MTLIGKVLAFLNLLIGLAILSWSVSVYVHRPGWFDKTEGVSPGQNPVNFAQLKDDIDNLARHASAASATWGAQLKQVQDLEKKRADRERGYARRLTWTRTGNRDDKDNPGAAFYEPKYEEGSGLLDLANLGAPVKGSDELPLKGYETLGASLAADTAKVVELAAQIEADRRQFAALGTQILQAESRLLKMGEIRDAVQAELFYLSTFEVNVYETRETVLRRKRQLTQRLQELGK